MPFLDTIAAIDCLEGLRRIPGESIDIVVTSPPYNLGKPYARYDDARPREEYLEWMGRIAGELRRVLKPEGSLFLNLGSRPLDPWIAIDAASEFRDHFCLQNTIHWVKSIAIAKDDAGDCSAIVGDIAVGHYQPVNSMRFLSQCHEYIFHFTKNGRVPLRKLAIGVPYQDKSNIGRWKCATRDRRDRGNAWFIPYETIRSSRPHPASFPPQLPEMCIRLHGFTRETVVLDPFMGIGSTAVACRRLGVHCIGFEIDPDYIRIAQQRISEA